MSIPIAMIEVPEDIEERSCGKVSSIEQKFGSVVLDFELLMMVGIYFLLD
jgi:hypothetical protein